MNNDNDLILGEGLMSQISTSNTFYYEELTEEKLRDSVTEIFGDGTTTIIGYPDPVYVNYPITPDLAYTDILNGEAEVVEEQLSIQDILLKEHEENVKNL